LIYSLKDIFLSSKRVHKYALKIGQASEHFTTLKALHN